MRKRTSILVTNDDGIHAPGIYALWEAMQEMGDVTVMAPNTEKSAVGHAVTISDPIRIEPITRHGGFEGYAVNGTPAFIPETTISGSTSRKEPTAIFTQTAGVPLTA